MSLGSVLAVTTLIVVSSSALGAEVPVQSEETKPPPAVPAAPKKSPKYLDLRYDEDFSYLAGPPESFEPDFFDPIKYIELGSDWRLTLGGEVRFRVEAETNKSFGAREPAQDTFLLHRYLFHADLRYDETIRIFVQGITAFDEDRDLPPRPTDENKWDVHQAFIDLRIFGKEQPWTLRLGRQELRYGNERIVSPLDWVNTRRRFDAVKLFASYESFDLDFWYSKPIPIDRSSLDHNDEDFDFYGAYFTWKKIPRHGVDVYFFAVDDINDKTNVNGRSGDRSTYTLGSRFWGKTGRFDYEAELAGQWGTWAGDTVQAWSWAMDGGYTFEKTPWRPRVGAGFDWASGDEDPTDRKVGTFDQLFPLGHKYLGFLDLFGRQNITALNVNLSAWPVEKKVRTAAAFYSFWLNAEKDALYDVTGAPSLRDRTGNSGKDLGNELDLTVTWTVSRHSAILLGYSHFWSEDFVQETSPGRDADLFYVQYAFKF